MRRQAVDHIDTNRCGRENRHDIRGPRGWRVEHDRIGRGVMVAQGHRVRRASLGEKRCDPMNGPCRVDNEKRDIAGFRAATSRAVVELSQKVSVAKSKGYVDAYFVFAGHGDVDGGRGLLELSDGPLFGAELEALLKRLGGTRTHVILDLASRWRISVH